MRALQCKIAGRGYSGILPAFEGDGSSSAAEYYTKLRASVTALFQRECAVPHTVCTCESSVSESGGEVIVTVTLRRRCGGRKTGELSFTQTWYALPPRDYVMKKPRISGAPPGKNHKKRKDL